MTPASLDLPLDIPIAPADDPEPRAVWATVFADKHPELSFEQAMTVPHIAHGITQVSLHRARALAKAHK